MVRQFDSPWKDALDLFLKELLSLLFPDVHALIDWSKGYENLDAQLSEIVRESELGPTAADKLFRVALLNGQDVWLLIHIEVQSQPDAEFPARMFKYYYRIFDRYNQDVLSLAILGDDRSDWRPDQYQRSVGGCEVRFRFRPAKLLDWSGRKQELLHHPSPIAPVILAHLYSLETQHLPEERRNAKWRLIRQLYERGWTPEGIRQVYRLVDWFLELPRELEERLKSDLRAFEEEQRMPYVTSIERMGREEGERKGRDAILDIIEPALKSRYGDEGAEFAQKLHAVLDIDTLRKISRAALYEAKTIDELRAMLP